MSWTNEKNLDILLNFFSKNKANLKDYELQALKDIATEITNQTKPIIKDNIILAKIVCIILKEKVSSGIGINQAVQDLTELINESIESHITYLQGAIFLKEIPNELTKDDMINKIKQSYNYNQVAASLEKTINEWLKIK